VPAEVAAAASDSAGGRAVDVVLHARTNVPWAGNGSAEAASTAGPLVGLSLALPGGGGSGTLRVENLSRPVRIAFAAPAPGPAVRVHRRCVYWEPGASGAGGQFSVRGVVTEEAANGSVTCVTSHLSLFAVQVITLSVCVCTHEHMNTIFPSYFAFRAHTSRDVEPLCPAASQ
jgi:hypothetical protein